MVNETVNSKRLIGLFVIVGLVLLSTIGAGGYYFGKQSVQDVTPSPTITLPRVTPSSSNSTSDWNTYTSRIHGFSINYPETVQGQWEYEEHINAEGTVLVGFRPSSVKEDYAWGVNVYENKSAEQIIKEGGSQFKDRNESRKNISLNGNSAILVTVTTNQYPDWILKTIIVEKNGKVYEIVNGAVDSPEFDSFYSSFRLLN